MGPNPIARSRFPNIARVAEGGPPTIPAWAAADSEARQHLAGSPYALLANSASNSLIRSLSGDPAEETLWHSAFQTGAEATIRHTTVLDSLATMGRWR